MPVIRCRVVCGLLEMMLTLAPTRRLSSVDFPTLGRPMIATVPARCAGIGSDTGRELIGLARGFLLGAAPARAFPQRPDTELRNRAFDLELLFMRFAAGGHHG